jgi:diaminopimelate decarboxylase
MRIYVSGLYSGTNPQPGVGIARSIRSAYPDAELIGVEYSNRCSGIHWKDFDDIRLHRPWDELNLKSHAVDIQKVLDDGGLWISSIDLEIMWLATLMPDGHPRLLTPPLDALKRVVKPAIPAHEGLPVKIPEYVTTELSDWELHSFCRRKNWKVWLKGPYYEAVRTPSWAELKRWRGVLTTAWAVDSLSLQEHRSGYEESVMLCAYKGELLDCVYMRKRDLTELGKTWAGDTLPVPSEIIYPLREIIRQLKWTGGAELEMIRDPEGQLWLLEWNPRFPAWVHGATITGRNLPATLVEGATAVPAITHPPDSPQFARVVIEIPVRAEYPLPPLPEPLGGAIGHSLKHPSGLIEFANHLRKDEKFENPYANGHSNKGDKNDLSLPKTILGDIEGLDIESIETPVSVFLESTATEYFDRARRFTVELSSRAVSVRNAYSIKTNPDERLIKLALDNGFYAECISLLEAQKAVDVGFRPEQVILNGPAKWWRRTPASVNSFYSIFCDSLEEYARVVNELEEGAVDTQVLGIRLRPPSIPSRFGVPIAKPDEFIRVVEAVRRLPNSCRLGLHFHMASSNIGVQHWKHLFDSMLHWCRVIRKLSGREIELLDLGGGWFPDDAQSSEGAMFREAIQAISDQLPSVRKVITEPGKALAQPSTALAMQILEVRRMSDDRCEAVVDASIAELPMHFFHPHRILYKRRNSKVWRQLGRGKTALLGRLCMEHDIVATEVGLPDDARAGDYLIFCDAGAYDRSMSYVFGRG